MGTQTEEEKLLAQAAGASETAKFKKGSFRSAKVDPMKIYDANAQPIELSKESPVTKALKKLNDTAKLRRGISDPTKAFSAELTGKEAEGAINTPAQGLRDIVKGPDNGADMRPGVGGGRLGTVYSIPGVAGSDMTITGRAPKQGFADHNKAGIGSPYDVTFAPGTSQATKADFMRTPVHGGARARSNIEGKRRIESPYGPGGISGGSSGGDRLGSLRGLNTRAANNIRDNETKLAIAQLGRDEVSGNPLKTAAEIELTKAQTEKYRADALKAGIPKADADKYFQDQFLDKDGNQQIYKMGVDAQGNPVKIPVGTAPTSTLEMPEGLAATASKEAKEAWSLATPEAKQSLIAKWKASQSKGAK